MAIMCIASWINFKAFFLKSSHTVVTLHQGYQRMNQLYTTVTWHYLDEPRLQLLSKVSDILNSLTNRAWCKRISTISGPLMPHGRYLRDGNESRQPNSRLNCYTNLGAVNRRGSMNPLLRGLRFYSMTKNAQPLRVLTKKQRLKIILKEYGKTALILYVGISLLTLGIVHLLVCSDVDLKPLLKKLTDGSPESEHRITQELLSKSSNFWITYSIYGMLMPLRLIIILSLTPISARFLRRRGIIQRSTHF